MHVVEDLDGTNVARAFVAPTGVSLTLLSPVTTVNGAHYPSEHFSIGSWEGIESLHDLLGRMISSRPEVQS